MILYRITNAADGKQYIGITSKTLRRRICEHFSKAARGVRGALYDAIRAHGRDAFDVTQIAHAADWSSLKAMEIAAIDLFATLAPSGYNSTLGGQGALGRKVSIGTRIAIGQAHRGKLLSEPHKTKLIKFHTGRKQDPDWIEKRAAKIRAKWRDDPIYRQRITSAATGRRHSAETRARISMARRASQNAL